MPFFCTNVNNIRFIDYYRGAISANMTEDDTIGYKKVRCCRESILSAFARGALWPEYFDVCSMKIKDVGKSETVNIGTRKTTAIKVDAIWGVTKNGKMIEVQSARPYTWFTSPIVYKPGQVYTISKEEQKDELARFYYWMNQNKAAP